MTKSTVPNATIKRLPIYYRYFQFLKDEGTQKISSGELSDGIKIDSATIRRDFSYLGALGKRGYGYDVNELVAFFKKLLNQDKRTNVALVGVGNLGNALLNYNFSRTNNVRIAAAFDIDKSIVGTVKSGVPVYDISEIKEQLSLQQIDVVILTVSSLFMSPSLFLACIKNLTTSVFMSNTIWSNISNPSILYCTTGSF